MAQVQVFSDRAWTEICRLDFIRPDEILVACHEGIITFDQMREYSIARLSSLEPESAWVDLAIKQQSDFEEWHPGRTVDNQDECDRDLFTCLLLLFWALETEPSDADVRVAEVFAARSHPEWLKGFLYYQPGSSPPSHSAVVWERIRKEAQDRMGRIASSRA